jgi:hypothetical protein
LPPAASAITGREAELASLDAILAQVGAAEPATIGNQRSSR